MGKKARRKAPQRYRPPPQKSAPNDPGEPRAAAATPESENEAPQEEPKLIAEAEPDPDPKLPDDGPLKCRHLKRGLSLEKLGEKLASFSAAALVCPTCKKTPKASSGKKKKQLRRRKQDLFDSSSLWICLACGNVGCSRPPDHPTPEEPDDDHQQQQPFANGHALEHSRRLRHPLALQIGDALSIWCFECNSTIASQTDLVNGLEAMGPRGETLQQAVEVIQGSFFKKGTNNPQEGGGVLELQPERNGVVRGLMNLGNTCFFNSVMQNLVAIRGLREFFLHPVTGLTEGEGPLTSALRRFYREFTGELSEQKSTYNPKGLFGAVCSKSARFSGYQQQDSHELLRCLLEGLHLEEEGLRPGEGDRKAGEKMIHTFVDRFFGGDFESTLTCCECGYSSSVLEPFHDISLPIPVPEGGTPVSCSSAAPSKRELKGKKLMMERRKRSFMAKVSVEPVRKQPAQSIVNKQAASGASAAEASSFWLDYIADDFVDVSLEEPEPEAELLEATDTSITTQAGRAAGFQAPAASSTEPGESSITQEATTDASTTTTTTEVQSSSGTSLLVQVGDETPGAPAAPQQAGNSAAKQISKDDLEKVLSELIPLDEAAPPSGSDSTLVPGSEQKFAEEANAPGGVEVEGGGGGGEAVPLPTNGEVDEALCSAPPVIALPYWGAEYTVPEPTGWEIVPAAGSGESEGLADLFHEEEAGVVLGPVNRDGVGPDSNPAPAYEEPEEIVERSIYPMTLEGCLLAFTKMEVLSGDNAWQCSRCSEEENRQDDGEVTSSFPKGDGDDEDEDGGGGNPEKRKKQRKRSDKSKAAAASPPVVRNATKSLAIKRAPPVLTVHLKRFGQDIRGKLNKLTGHVTFEELLDLNQFQGSRDSGESCVYRLVGVVEHSGTMRGGHYVAFVRVESPDADSSSWYCISDSSVWQTTLDQVLRSEAYLLFYERV